MIYLDKDILLNSLICHASEIGLPINEVSVFIRPYSKTFLGRYFPVPKGSTEKAKIYIYPFETLDSLMDYSDIFETFVHEMCHHIQYKDSDFMRLKGVMHNQDFWLLYNFYMKKAKNFNLMEIYHDSKSY